MMNSQHKLIADEIINELYKHPITTSLRKIPAGNGSATDLDTIKQKLKQDKYQNLASVFNDLETVWAELVKRNGDDVSSKIASECRKILGKLRNKYDISELPQWCNVVYKVRGLLTNVMTQPPETITQNIPSIGKARPIKPSKSGMSEREMYNFLQASDMIKKDEDHREMIRIVNELQPDIDCSTQDVNVNINELNAETAEALKNYMRTALEKQGLRYPE